MSSRDQKVYLESEQLSLILSLNRLSNTFKHCLTKIWSTQTEQMLTVKWELTISIICNIPLLRVFPDSRAERMKEKMARASGIMLESLVLRIKKATDHMNEFKRSKGDLHWQVYSDQRYSRAL